ncbi:MAG: hypothetical protein OXH73_11975 [Caldilineaceae bacterium]|nr:hypothetical protein [Caldilineaceae bacterium]
MAGRALPQMPIYYKVLRGEIWALLREDETLMKSEVKRAMVRARNMALDMSDPCYDIWGPSWRGITSHRTMVNCRFDLA